MRPPVPLPTIEDIRSELALIGVSHVGIADASHLARARQALDDRKQRGFADTMGFTWRHPDRATNPRMSVNDAQSVIVAAMPYESLDDEPPAGRRAAIAKYARRNYYDELRTGLRTVAKSIRRSGHRAVAFADDNALVDREIAHRAGMGWFGKNANLLVPGAGSFFVLGSIITTAEYPIDQPVGDGCGTCERCFSGCPTDAIVSPGVIDARRCLAWLLQRPGTFPHEYREVVGARIYGCDDCQDSCPPTVRLSGRMSPRALPTHGTWVDPLEILNATDDDILNRFGTWYIHQRNPKWLRRNAVIALGNTAASDDHEAFSVLRTVASGNDDTLAEHAVWALQRLEERSNHSDGEQ